MKIIATLKAIFSLRANGPTPGEVKHARAVLAEHAELHPVSTMAGYFREHPAVLVVDRNLLTAGEFQRMHSHTVEVIRSLEQEKKNLQKACSEYYEMCDKDDKSSWIVFLGLNAHRTDLRQVKERLRQLHRQAKFLKMMSKVAVHV
jgi:hypothetical protein